MGRKVNIVVDASGSMIEDDKNVVVEYLLNGIVNTIQSSKFNHVEFKLYQWGKETKQIKDIEKIKLKFAGKAGVEGLEILGHLIDKDEVVLLISDGNIERGERKKIEKLAENIITIYVGIDANKALLRDISTNKVVYSVMDFMQALFDAQK